MYTKKMGEERGQFPGNKQRKKSVKEEARKQKRT